MELYFAPMEGITTYTYRNIHSEIFGMCDEYFAPFIVPTDNERISTKTLRDILPEKNIAKIVPQVMCTSPEAFVKFCDKIKPLGFTEINLNLGCPSGTVVKKNRGSGALIDTDGLDRFLDYIFKNADLKISVKTRAGFYSHDEFDGILEVYGKYPISRLIVHPRVREEYYKGLPNMESFRKAYEKVKTSLCYNGNVYSVADFNSLCLEYPDLTAVMIGRGAITNPAIFREIRGGNKLSTEELILFSNRLENDYLEVLGCEKYTLHRLKEIWLHIMMNFPEEKKILKAVKKSNRLMDINSAINCLPRI